MYKSFVKIRSGVSTESIVKKSTFAKQMPSPYTRRAINKSIKAVPLKDQKGRPNGPDRATAPAPLLNDLVVGCRLPGIDGRPKPTPTDRVAARQLSI